jgi:predicted enzyme related to lactoylglutathione lyase
MKEDPNKMSTFVHMELSTSDVEAAKEFYQAIFGWQYHDMDSPTGPYTFVMAGEKPIGGMQANPMPEVPSNWLGYIGVESVARTVAEIESHGGKVLLPETQVGEMGKLAIFTDPQGAAFAIWEAVMPAASEPPPSAKKASKKKAAKKAAAKEAPTEEATAKKAGKKASKKAPAKKAPAKKAPAKKAPAKKASAKEAAEPAPAKKATAKKATAKKATAKKATAKKATAKKAAKKAAKK